MIATSVAIFMITCTFAFPFIAMYLMSKNYAYLKKGIVNEHFNPFVEGIKVNSRFALIYYYYGMFLV